MEEIVFNVLCNVVNVAVVTALVMGVREALKANGKPKRKEKRKRGQW